MKKVIVSAPGKLHLSGEHAVVYGNPAIAISTSLRLTVTLELQNGKTTLRAMRNEDAYIDTIVKAFESQYGIFPDDGLYLRIDSAIPPGSGMGSSASLAVALIGALSVWYGLPWNTKIINDTAYQAEKVQHGNSSGSDPAIATNGGIIWYRKELEFLKTLWLLTLKIPSAFMPFVLINTGRTESTGELVSHVATVRNRDEAAFALLLNDVEAVTKNMAQTIHDEDEPGFRQAIQKNERLLENMEIVSVDTRALIADIERAGGVAKISGAGGRARGSGVVIAIHDTPGVLTEIAKHHGYPSFRVQLGGEGIRMEQVLV